MDNFKVQKIEIVDQNIFNDLRVLFEQWNPNQKIEKEYFDTLRTSTHLIGLFDARRLVGIVTLVPLYKLSGLKGSIEHLLVHEKYRGRGLGEKLMKETIEVAKKLNMQAVSLTCEPHREAASGLYKKLGFEKQDTNFYKLSL